jgi:phenylacetic acid degradation operon negative regulatory protein
VTTVKNMSNVAGTLAAVGARAGSSTVRPRSVLLSFLALYVLDRPVAVYSRSVIDVFDRVGVSERALRSTLARMVARGLLARHRRGRKMYFGLTARSTAVLADGHRRVWRAGAVNREWDGGWTMVGFSLPDSWRSQRHALRARLVWAGFGPLRNGLWITPGPVDVPALLDGLDLAGHVRVLTGRPAAPTDDAGLIRAAFDVDAIAADYRAFLARWERPRPLPDAPDDLARQLLLHTDWLRLVRADPRLPAAHLPPDWPAIRAEATFRRLAHAYQGSARPIADAVLDTVAVAPSPA